jgi:carboxymethylenebutenolidase
MAEIKTEWINLTVADRTTMRAYVARPRDTNQHTGLLVYHEAFGVKAHIRDVAERVAREGFVTVAPNCFTAPRRASRQRTAISSWLNLM